MAIALLMSSCYKKPPLVLESFVVEKLVEKYVKIPEKLTSPCLPIYVYYPRWINKSTWLELYYENRKTIELCNKKLKLIKQLPIPN